MKKLGFIGYGELGRQIAAFARGQAEPNCEVTYFDDLAHAEGLPGAVPFSTFTEERHADTSFFVCLGYKHLKKNSRSSNN
jgi:phosphoglycerate dehydrogenase-like enzyme